MRLRKITVDISVKYTPKSQKRKDKFIKPNTFINKPLPRKQSKIFSQKSKKFVIDYISWEAFGFLKRINKNYF